LSAASAKGDDQRRAAAEAVRAGTIVSGSFYRQRDSVQFDARVIDAGSGSLLRSVGPVAAAAADPLKGVEVLRQRVMGSLAAILDPAFSNLGSVTAQPPSFAAYREFITGEEALARGEYRDAVAAYERAAAPGTPPRNRADTGASAR
jgi:hypothetical protein